MGEETDEPGVWEALRRRKLVQWALAYAAAAWALLQVLGLLAGAYHWPDAVLRIAIGAVALGFCVALVLAWFHGERGHQRMGAVELSILAALLIVGGGLLWQIERSRPVEVVAAAASSTAGRSDIGGVPAPARAAESGSLAVLPFAVLGQGTATQDFSEGLHDDLLTQLVKLGGLRVIARTSVLGYRNTSKPATVIGRELGVSALLEGGVQRSADSVRVNVQLIDAQADAPLWAESYQRELSATNLFEIQREIATAIAGVLKMRLTPQEQQRLAEVPTRDLAAYDDYLHGRNLFRRDLVRKDVEDAELAFESAVQRDPAYADAWAMLSIARSSLAWEWGIYDQVPAAEAAVAQAQRLAPDARLSLVAAGYVRYYGHRDYDGALALLKRAEALAPNDPDVLLPIGFVLRRQGQFRAAIGYFERSMQLDPLAVDPVNSAAVSEYLLRNYDRAQQLWERVFSLDPNVSFPYRQLARTMLMRSADREGAEALVRRAGGRVPLTELVFSDGALARIVGPRFAEELLSTPLPLGDWPRVMYTKIEGISPVDAHFGRGMLLRELGREAEARREFETVVELANAAVLESDLRPNSYQGSLHSTLAVALAALGQRQRALEMGHAGVAAFGPQGDRFYDGYRKLDLAAVYVLNGDKDRAFDELEAVLSVPGPLSTALLGIDPLWAPLRGDPRFAALLARHAAAASSAR